MRLGIDSVKPLDVLARESLEPEEALNNGLPTVLEFYADWCEVCQKMAPSMLDLKEEYENKIDLVMLNVDNERWLDLIEKYEVIGIPQLVLFDKDGLNKGKLIGFKSNSQLEEVADFLLAKSSTLELLSLNNIDYDSLSLSPLNQKNNLNNIAPMSHG